MGVLGYAIVFALLIEAVLLGVYIQNTTRKWALYSAVIWVIVFLGSTLFMVYSFSQVFK